MIYKNTILNIIDNCGARKAKCIHVLGKFKWAKIGDLVLVVLRKFYNQKKKIKKGGVYLGIITGVKFWVLRSTGFYYRFFSNRIIIFSLQFKFLATRVYGLISREFKKKIYRFRGIRFYYKLLAYSSAVL
jgi:large subunit ribosomal protein L14